MSANQKEITILYRCDPISVDKIVICVTSCTIANVSIEFCSNFQMKHGYRKSCFKFGKKVIICQKSKKNPISQT